MVDGFGKRHYIIAAIAAVVVIAAFLFARTVPSAPAPSLISDAYPLYEGISWSAAHAAKIDAGSLTLVGAEAVSEPVKDIEDIASHTEPFEAYYATKLRGAGWAEDEMLAADGPGSSVRVYRKDDEYLVLRYTSDFKAGGANEPAQCPCDLTFSVFTGTIR